MLNNKEKILCPICKAEYLEQFVCPNGQPKFIITICTKNRAARNKNEQSSPY